MMREVLRWFTLHTESKNQAMSMWLGLIFPLISDELQMCAGPVRKSRSTGTEYCRGAVCQVESR